MKRSLLIVIIAGITLSSGAWLVAQTDKSPPPPDLQNTSSAPTSATQPSVKPDDLLSSPVPLKTTTVELNNLRNRFVELCKKKSLMMKDPQLKREIEALEAEIPELEAWAKADEAVQLLHEVIEKHPNTQAAGSANAAIELIQRRARGDQFRKDDGFGPRRNLIPVPDRTVPSNHRPPVFDDAPHSAPPGAPPSSSPQFSS